jgi:hypothetical protein
MNFFDAFYDITVTDVDARPGRDLAGQPDGASVVLRNCGPFSFESVYVQVFDKDQPGFGLALPPETSPYRADYIYIEIPMTGDINGNGQPDKIKFTMAVQSVQAANRTFNSLPNGTVIGSFEAGMLMGGAVADWYADPPFTVGALGANGQPSAAVFGGPVTTAIDLQNVVLAPAEIVCPADMIEAAAAGQCSAAVNYTPPAVNGFTVACSPPPGSAFPVGATTVTCVADNGRGSTSSCSFSVTVVDREAPTIFCPPAITLDTDPGLCSATATYTVTAADNCPGVTVVCTPPSGSAFVKGTTPVSCTATDASGNSASCGFNVTVADREAPMILCPSDIILDTDPGLCSATATYTVTASDNCPGVTVVCAPPSGSAFLKGTTPVVCTATDASGNSASCGFNVTVADREPPVLRGLAVTPAVLWPANHKRALVTVNYQASDNCGAVSLSLRVISSEPDNGLGDGDQPNDVGYIAGDPHHVYLRAERSGRGTGRTYTILVTATDSSGNSVSSQVIVAVPHSQR